MYMYLVHDDGTINGQLQVCECVAHIGYHFLHSVNLLSQENVERLKVTHFAKSISDLKLKKMHKLYRKLILFCYVH